VYALDEPVPETPSGVPLATVEALDALYGTHIVPIQGNIATLFTGEANQQAQIGTNFGDIGDLKDAVVALQGASSGVITSVLAGLVYDKIEEDGLLLDKADTSDVYSKIDADGLLVGKADKIDVYSKSDADGLLLDKADKTDVYTKTEADTLLLDKADKIDVYSKDLVYQKSESNGLMFDKADKTDVYLKSEVDGLLQDLGSAVNFLIYSGRRSLVGYAKIKFNTFVTFNDLQLPYNLTATYINSTSILFTFVQWKPRFNDYIVDLNSVNIDLTVDPLGDRRRPPSVVSRN
jgi:hypothetical protein